MGVLKSVVMAFSTFSRLPMPQIDWEERSMRYMMCAFPLVGLAIGLLILAWWQVCALAGFGSLLRAAGAVAIPYLVTGGIHLDGFADVTDALSSRAEPERMRRILKDPHVGAFAVMGIAVYLIVYLALASELDAGLGTAALLGLMHAMSRCSSSLATLIRKGSSEEGMLASFRNAAAHKRVSCAVVACQALVYAAGMFVLDPVACVLMLAACIANFFYATGMAERRFGGMSGDVAGYLLQCAEIAMLAMLVCAQKAVM